MSRTHQLKLPLSAADVGALALGDMVYLSGELVITAGLPTHQRMLEYLAAGKPLPIDMNGAVLLQFGGYSHESEHGLQVGYMNPTTSTRFNPMMPTLIRKLGLRAVGGKGGLDAECARAMREAGCVYLSFPGGLCTPYTQAIREVVAVEWRDFILHYRLVKLRVENLGPGTVGIDAQGRSRYDELQGQAQARLGDILRGLDAARGAK